MITNLFYKNFSSYQLIFDFSTSSTQAIGDNLIKVDTPNVFAIYSGDVNQEGLIDITDLAMIYNDAVIGVEGYVNTDLDGDNFVDVSDLSLDYNNLGVLARTPLSGENLTQSKIQSEGQENKFNYYK